MSLWSISNRPSCRTRQRVWRSNVTLGSSRRRTTSFASALASGQGLKQSGVDVVDLGNNHVFDGGESGMKQTIEVLDAAGIKHFGAGLDEASAWRPLFLTRKGQRFAFIGCTTITGEDQLTTYVAAGNKGGAAKCEASRLSAAVADARAQQASVIVMIHGGYEYVRTMSPAVEQLTEAAAHAGAFAVINGHPHVIGAIRHVGSTLVADTMGNLLFDQTVWPTYPSYVLRLDVSDGQVKRTAADPIWHEQFVPRPTTGHLADVAARIAAGAPDAAVADTGADADSAASKLEVDLSLPARQVVVLPPGVTLTSSPSPSLRAGRDLLFSGGFEDLDTDVSTRGALGWDLGRGSRVSGDAACDGSIGVTMTAISGRTSVLHPRLHQLVAGGRKLTLVADIARLEGQAELVVSWFPDTRGPSNGATRMKVPAVGPQCRQARLDVTVPNGVVAAEPSVELQSAVGSPAHLDVDNVRLVAWSTTPALGGDVVDSGTATPVKVLRP
ncbi:MAG: CapA family protein [Actinomycetales bacterium]